jgi:hypothetical protein
MAIPIVDVPLLVSEESALAAILIGLTGEPPYMFGP